jgi:sensor histidine kinase YesM
MPITAHFPLSAFFAHPKGRVPYYVHVLLWAFVESMQLLFFYYFFPISLAIVQALSNLPCFIFVFYANVWLIDRFMERKQYMMYAALAFLLLLGVSVLRYWLNLQFESYEKAFPIIENPSKMLAFMLVSTAVVQVVSALYRLLENRMVEERQRLQQLSELATAQLHYLKAQINPHFLFNTLNNIYALAVLKSDAAPQMILRLSELLRYAIYGTHQAQVPVQEEARHIEQYIGLFQMRAETPLHIQFEVEREALDCHIAPMLLLPLVENCFKHGDFDSNAHAFAKFVLKAENGNLCFTAENTFAAQKHIAVGGVGLQNVRQRLALLYPHAHQLELNGNAGLFKATLQIKQHPK